MGIRGGLKFVGIAVGYAAGYAVDKFDFLKKGSDKYK